MSWATGGDSEAGAVVRSLANLFGDEVLNPRPDKFSTSRSISVTPEPNQTSEPSNFPPETLQEFLLKAAESRSLEKDRQLDEWISYWSKAGKKVEVYQSLKAVSERERFFRNHDHLFKLALELYGKEEAYQWLVKAHREDNGWARYWTDASKPHARFAVVKQYYPERWMNFICDTVKSEHGEPWTDVSIGSTAWVRMLEFCIALDQLSTAFALTEQTVKSALELVPLQLPIPLWISPLASANRSLDMLFDQLRWPSVLVKERACTVINELIRDSTRGKEARQKLVQWLP